MKRSSQGLLSAGNRERTLLDSFDDKAIGEWHYKFYPLKTSNSNRPAKAVLRYCSQYIVLVCSLIHVF
jgi:hypothetical protein